MSSDANNETPSAPSGRLSRAIDESLRILPIVPFGARIAAEPTEIAGRAFPRKSRILIPFHLIHHDPALYASPRHGMPVELVDTGSPWIRARITGDVRDLVELDQD